MGALGSAGARRGSRVESTRGDFVAPQVVAPAPGCVPKPLLSLGLILGMGSVCLLHPGAWCGQQVTAAVVSSTPAATISHGRKRSPGRCFLTALSAGWGRVD